MIGKLNMKQQKNRQSLTSLARNFELNRGCWHFGHNIFCDDGRKTWLWQCTHPFSSSTLAPPRWHIGVSAFFILNFCPISTFKWVSNVFMILFKVVVAQPVARCTFLSDIEISSMSRRSFLTFLDRLCFFRFPRKTALSKAIYSVADSNSALDRVNYE